MSLALEQLREVSALIEENIPALYTLNTEMLAAAKEEEPLPFEPESPEHIDKVTAAILAIDERADGGSSLRSANARLRELRRGLPEFLAGAGAAGGGLLN